MPNLDELSLRKIIGLILDFYKDPCGFISLHSLTSQFSVSNCFVQLPWITLFPYAECVCGRTYNISEFPFSQDGSFSP